MSHVTFQLPESLHRSIQALAEREGYSIDQFLASAAAEKLAALRTKYACYLGLWLEPFPSWAVGLVAVPYWEWRRAHRGDS